MGADYLEPENIVWQTRQGVEPSSYEKALVEALEAIFDDQEYEIGTIVARLNRTALKPDGGGAWTEAIFEAEMKRLGDRQFQPDRR